jgi:serine/threonine protein kinase
LARRSGPFGGRQTHHRGEHPVHPLSGHALHVRHSLNTLDPPCEPTPRPPATAAQIGKYRIVARLGEGATSEVFLAATSSAGATWPSSACARPGWPDRGEATSARFFAAEAALVGRLQHPNVVQIYDAVFDPARPTW